MPMQRRLRDKEVQQARSEGAPGRHACMGRAESARLLHIIQRVLQEEGVGEACGAAKRGCCAAAVPVDGLHAGSNCSGHDNTIDMHQLWSSSFVVWQGLAETRAW